MRIVQLKKAMLALVALVTFALAQAQTYVGIPRDKFDYVAATQRNDHWCWAATIEMLMNYYNIPITQEEVVERTFGTDRNGDLPDFPASHEIMTENLNTAEMDANGKLKQIYATHNEGTPDAIYLIEQLSNHKPVIIAYETGESTEHAVIITGISYNVTTHGPEIESIIVRDPWPSEEKENEHGRVEYTAEQLYHRITAFWDVNIGTADANQFAHYNNGNRNFRKTSYNRSNDQYDYTRNVTESYNDDRNYYSSTSTAASSMSDRNGNTYKPTAASSSSTYSAYR